MNKILIFFTTTAQKKQMRKEKKKKKAQNPLGVLKFYRSYDKRLGYRQNSQLDYLNF